MFEKDEDYRKARKESKDRITKVIKVWSAREETLHDEGFQKGAEFGYNKANEWHYVKDGDLPKKTGEYLVYRISGYGNKSIELVQYNSSRHFWCVDCQNEVIAWKEIVLPKESEK